MNEFTDGIKKEIRFVGSSEGAYKAGNGTRALPESDRLRLNSDSHFLAGDLRQIT